MPRRITAGLPAALLVAAALNLTGCASEVREGHASTSPTPTSSVADSVVEHSVEDSGDSESSATPTDTEASLEAPQPHDGDYATVSELLKTWEATTELDCDQMFREPFDGSEATFLCEDDTVINWYATQNDLLEHVTGARESMVEGGMYREWIIGDNWSVRPEIGSSVDMIELSAMLGGFSVGLGDIEDKD